MSSRWWSTARSIRILTRRGEILFFFSNFKSRNGSNMIFFRIHMDPLDHWSVKSHTTWLNFLSILTKQCTILNTTHHWYLNIPLDQTHPFLKGFYYFSVMEIKVALPSRFLQCIFSILILIGSADGGASISREGHFIFGIGVMMLPSSEGHILKMIKSTYTSSRILWVIALYSSFFWQSSRVASPTCLKEKSERTFLILTPHIFLLSFLIFCDFCKKISLILFPNYSH